MKKKANLFIVGAHKSGTTSLYHYLEKHSKIFMSTPKEVSFFCKDFHKQSDNFHGKQLYFNCRTQKQYDEIFSKAKPEHIIKGDTSPYYMYSDVALKNIKKYNPYAKIIVMIRNPIDFIYSWYSDNYYINNEDAQTLEEAIRLESKRKKDWSLIPKNATMPARLFYRDISAFSKHINKCYENFPKEQVKLILFDDLKENPEKVYKEVLEFLEVEYESVEFEIHNANKVPKNKFIDSIIKNIRVRKIITTLLPFSFTSKLGGIISLLNTKEVSREPLEPFFKNKLKKQYLQEVKKLSKLFNRDLVKKWGYDKLT